MTPKRPYLLRAMIDWIIDNESTPYLVVEAGEGVQVPQSYVTDGRIVLNVSPLAVRDFSINNDFVMFDGRFGGQSFPVTVPLHAVIAVYSKETGEGMLFEPEYPAKSQTPPISEEGSGSERHEPKGSVTALSPKITKRRGHLTPVK